MPSVLVGAHNALMRQTLVLLSTFGDGRVFLREFHNQGFKIHVFAERRFVNERLTLFRLSPAAQRPS